MTLSASMILVDQTAVPLTTADAIADLNGGGGRAVAGRAPHVRAAGGAGDPCQPAEIDKFKEYILQAEQAGRSQTAIDTRPVRVALQDNLLAHVDSFRITFLTSAGIALLGALFCFILVRRENRYYVGPVFGRRSRWTYAGAGTTPGITRHPPDSTAPGPPGDRSGSPPP